MSLEISKEHWIPIVESSGKIKFDKGAVILFEPNPYPANINKLLALKNIQSSSELQIAKDVKITDINTKRTGLLSNNTSLIIHLSNAKKLSIKPEGSPFLDLDIEYRQLGITYYPKNYIDISNQYKGTYEKLSLNSFIELNMLNNLLISQMVVNIGNQNKNISIVIKGVLLFSKLDHFKYNHDDEVIVSIYPDRMYNFINSDTDPNNDIYSLEIASL